MATDSTLLQGEVIEDPASQELDVEQLLVSFLRALLDEQKLGEKTAGAASLGATPHGTASS